MGNNILNAREIDEVVSIKRYVCFYLLQYIPIVGLIWAIVKAFDSSENTSYRNLCKAHLMVGIIGIGVVILIWIIIIVLAVGMSILSY